MKIYVIPKECVLAGAEESLHFGEDLAAAQKCLLALETVNPGSAFRIVDSYQGGSRGCSCNFSLPRADYNIEIGLIDNCDPAGGGEFDSWDSFLNMTNANECARELNVIERSKPVSQRLNCFSVNVGGYFVDNYRVICK